MWEVSCPLISGSTTSLFPFFTNPQAFFNSDNLKSHRYTLLAVKCANVQFSLSFVKHFAAIGCCVEIICSWPIGPCQLIVSQPLAWLFLQHLSRKPKSKQRSPTVLLKIAQVRIHIVGEIDACMCQAGKRTIDFLPDRFLVRFHNATNLTKASFVTDTVFFEKVVVDQKGQTPHSRKRTGSLTPNRPTKKMKWKIKRMEYKMGETVKGPKWKVRRERRRD